MIIANKQKYLDDLQNQFLKSNLPTLEVGDGVKIGVKIIEGTKERIQFYEGTIIAKKK